MSKLFYIKDGICFNDLTMLYTSLEQAKSYYSMGCTIVEAPDYVFEGWGFNPLEEGDKRFVKPETPEGFIYDERTGTFYRQKTNKEKRREAYSQGFTLGESGNYTVLYDEQFMTVDSLATLALKYCIRGEIEKCNEIVEKINELVNKIREDFPEKE